MSSKEIYISKDSKDGQIINNLQNFMKDVNALSKFDKDIEQFDNNNFYYNIIIIILFIIVLMILLFN
jgi:hypothetical protein